MKILQGINIEATSHQDYSNDNAESRYKHFKEKYYKCSIQDLSLLVSDAVNNFIAAKEFKS